jgi:ParB/RepB/Spo0J family partition protein
MILTDTVTALRLDDLVANPLNPRAELGEVDELAASIRELGLLQPLLVVQTSFADGTPSEVAEYMVIDGHRRFAALQLLDFDDEIPVRVVDDPGTAGRLLIALSAGMHGRPLAPLDEARAFQSLVDLDMTQRQIAERVGCNQSHVSKRLSLLALDDDKAQALSEGKIKVRDAERVARGKPEPVVKVTVTDISAEVWERERDVLRKQVDNYGAEINELVDEVEKYKGAALEMAGANEKLKDEVEQLHSMCDLLRARIVELETPHATIPAGQEMMSVGQVWAAVDAGTITAVDDDDLFPPSIDWKQELWETEHPDASSTLPWPPYRKTPAEGIVKFLRTTINQVNTVRHVIAYESTHEQRQEILQAASDRLFELS